MKRIHIKSASWRTGDNHNRAWKANQSAEIRVCCISPVLGGGGWAILFVQTRRLIISRSFASWPVPVQVPFDSIYSLRCLKLVWWNKEVILSSLWPLQFVSQLYHVRYIEVKSDLRVESARSSQDRSHNTEFAGVEMDLSAHRLRFWEGVTLMRAYWSWLRYLPWGGPDHSYYELKTYGGTRFRSLVVSILETLSVL